MSEMQPQTRAVGENSSAAHSSRRRLLIGGVGLAAGAAGAGLAWWRTRQAGPAQTGELPPEGFWSLQWDSAQGDPLPMASFRGKPLLVNFWATWCAPCLEEMPLIADFFNKNRANGWQVLGLAVDRPVAVQSYLRQGTIQYPIGMAGSNSGPLLSQLGNMAGALPFTVVLGADGSILQRKLGKWTSADLAVLAQLK